MGYGMRQEGQLHLHRVDDTLVVHEAPQALYAVK
jgi:hypothetical protein